MKRFKKALKTVTEKITNKTNKKKEERLHIREVYDALKAFHEEQLQELEILALEVNEEEKLNK